MKLKTHRDLSKVFSVVLLIVLYIFFCFAGTNFFSTEALISILDSSYYIGFMAIGVTFAIISGGIDLSIGTSLITAGIVGGVAYNNLGLPMGVCLLLCIITSCAFGLLNGFIIAKCKVVPFVVTLGMQMVISGFGAIISKVNTQHYPVLGESGSWFKNVFYKLPGGFPIGIVWLLVFFLIAWVILNKTRIGRYTFAIGSNEEATRLSGIDVDKWKIVIYLIVGFYCGMAGIMYASAYTSVVPSTGAGTEVLGISAVFIGGTSVSGGSGSMSGTILGVYIMTVLKQGLMSMGLQGHYQTFFTGIVVILAVILDNYRTRKSAK